MLTHIGGMGGKGPRKKIIRRVKRQVRRKRIGQRTGLSGPALTKVVRKRKRIGQRTGLSGKPLTRALQRRKTGLTGPALTRALRKRRRS